MDPDTGKAAYKSPTMAWKPQNAVGRRNLSALQGTGPAPKEREARQPQRQPLCIQYSLCCFVGSMRRSHSGTANLIINSLISSAGSQDSTGVPQSVGSTTKLHPSVVVSQRLYICIHARVHHDSVRKSVECFLA
jgi:hypothetical protein